jgi:D-cysteine desulfhydrase
MNNDIAFLKKLQAAVPASAEILSTLEQEASLSPRGVAAPVYGDQHKHVPLFVRYPALRHSISHISLGDFPTHIEKLEPLAKKYGVPNLYIKRDDASGPKIDGYRLFGGNKVRKLEFLLADALAHQAKTVVTFGYAGSNHALATTVYAKQIGLSSIALLLPQPNSSIVQRNLLLQNYYGAQLHEYETPELRDLGTIGAFLRTKQLTGSYPYLIPTGGSSYLGSLGFVNAAFELKEQIERGELPEPDYIYLAFSSMGTTAGLMVGLRAAGLKTRVIAVRVIDKEHYNEQTCLSLMRDTVAFLRTHDDNFPALSFSEAELSINHDYFGSGYGIVTPACAQALSVMKDECGIVLDGTYSGKACAALLTDLQKQELKNKTVLFWNTFCGYEFAHVIDKRHYHVLPHCFYKYFDNF